MPCRSPKLTAAGEKALAPTPPCCGACDCARMAAMFWAAEIPRGSWPPGRPRFMLPPDPGDPAIPCPVGGVRIAVGEGNSNGSIAEVSGLPDASGALPLLRGWPGTLRIIEKPSASPLRFGMELMRYEPAGAVCIGGSWGPEDTLA